MRNTDKLLAKALDLPWINGKGHLARVLEMGHPQLNQIMHGQRNLTDRQAILLAECLRKNPYEVITLVGIDRAANDAEREWWRRRAPRSIVGVLTVAMLIGWGFATPLSARLVDQTIHYAKYALRRMRRAISAPAIEPVTLTAA